ncbi:tyrosine-type recombinase/integrase [Caenispirillum bisanense]|uniref:tyrosine-type recombinase/integrase n=1 Tax=Caenispirillum bisanense TaxID=414052 RepID=UPI0031E2B943
MRRVADSSASHFARSARSPATYKAYADDWRDFTNWCAEHWESALPATAATVGRFLADRATALKPATLDGRLSAILIVHRQAGFVEALDRRHPAIADTLKGIRRALGTAPLQKEALSRDDLAILVSAQPNTLLGLRDRALLLLGWAGAFRRGELAALEVRDLTFTSEGLAVTIRRSKEDQEGKSQMKGLPLAANPDLCPVRAVRKWLMASSTGEGPLFRRLDRHGNIYEDGISGEAVALAVKRAVRLAGQREGWTKAEIARRMDAVAGHSLRAGLITAAAEAGATELQIMEISLHRSMRTLRGYVRRGSLFRSDVHRKVGL